MPIVHDLFEPISRDERQAQSVYKWLKNKGKGCLECCTGYGKSRCALIAIKKVLSKYPQLRVLIVVPTELLKNQWLGHIEHNQLQLNVEVAIINSVAKNGAQCDMLIIDEIHVVPAETFSNIFKTVKYKLILGLTATFERLDGKHKLLEKYCPIVDTVTVQEALLNGWVSKYNEYLVIIDVEDIDIYKEANREFNEHFEFFQWDFSLAMSMKDHNVRWSYCKQMFPGDYEKQKEYHKAVMYHYTGFMRTMRTRTQFIYNHPQKVNITREIIKYRPDKKIITFCANTKIADSIGEGWVYTGKKGKKKNRITLEEFSSHQSGVLNTCRLAETGMDIAGLSVGIMLGVNSSTTKATQTRGRVIRKEPNKIAEYFTLVINDTVELKWWEKSHEKDTNIIKIDVENLMHLLRGEPWQPYKKKITNFTFRF